METHQTAALSQSIRQVYKKRIFVPITYLLFLVILWFAAPVSGLVFPRQLSSAVPLRELRTNHVTYISTTLTDLRFTGYTQKILGYTDGYYYYTFQDDQCILVLLAPSACGKGLPEISRLRIRARVIQDFKEYDALTLHLAEDLGWTASGIRSQIPDILLSGSGSRRLLSFLLLGLYFISGACALVNTAVFAAYIHAPALSPAYKKSLLSQIWKA